MARPEIKKPQQPLFILLDHNIDVEAAKRCQRLARFRRIGEAERERRFQSEAEDRRIFQGPRRFLFVTHDQDFLDHSVLPGSHGGVLVFTCQPNQVPEALRRFLLWWGPKRNLMRNRILRLTATGGVEILRDGTPQRIVRQPQGNDRSPY